MTEYNVISMTTKKREIRNNESFKIIEKDGTLSFSKSSAFFGNYNYKLSGKSAGNAGFGHSQYMVSIQNFNGNFIFFQIGGNATKGRYDEMELIFANCITKQVNN